MIGFIEEFKQGYAGDESKTFSVADRAVRCPHCGGEDFDQGSALLNTAGATLFGLDWANRSAHTLICTGGSRIEWFLDKPERR